MSYSSGVNHFAGSAEHADLAPVAERLAAHALTLAGSGVEQHDIGDMDGCLALDDAARLVELRIRLGVALDQVEVLHEHAIADHARDFAALALALARGHDHLIAFSDSVHSLDLCRAGFNPPLRVSTHHRRSSAICRRVETRLATFAPYSTSGASETIFMKRSLRSSRVTGPKMRVPIGSSLLFSSTAALSSKRISEPSGRRTPLAVRTTTALYTSPFLTLLRGIASRIETLMTSPTLA